MAVGLGLMVAEGIGVRVLAGVVVRVAVGRDVWLGAGARAGSGAQAVRVRIKARKRSIFFMVLRLLGVCARQGCLILIITGKGFVWGREEFWDRHRPACDRKRYKKIALGLIPRLTSEHDSCRFD